MKWFTDQSVRTKLLLAFGFVCTLMLVMMYLGFSTAQTLKRSLDEQGRDLLPSSIVVG